MTEPTGDLSARQHVQQTPAETPLRTAHPAGGVDDDPQVLDPAAREAGDQRQ